ncbi:nuclear cap-binding protein subunit 3-like [Centruroides sculpturatus]|uniref:nuclear cap-binding protein subunit 3-like n=1 Tax=Centruroides sculpturatus TaxID=218467 RepID=UPI000C6D4A13|nr:nuclear cap-binding protein subunit 3-like [Centruroides sculpturatus]
MKKYENKSNIFASGLDLTSEKIQDKLGERAEKFYSEARPVQNITQEEIDALYKSMNIPVNSEKTSDKLRGIRLDAIHFRGVNDMSTEDIFDYFKDYSPSSIEWINDISCNVVWLDEKSAARALLELSRPIIIRSRKNNLEDNLDKNDKSETSEKIKEEGEEVVVMSDDDMSEDEVQEHILENDADDDMKKEEESKISEENTSEIKEKLDVVPIPVPPGQWRLGVSHPKAKALLLRFATKDDKKIRGAEKRSLYYKKYGNPNYGGMELLLL